MKTIVLISVGQPSTNPRLVKEANALQKAGFRVFVVYSFWSQWAWQTDKMLFSRVLWTPLLVGGTPFENKFYYFLTRIRAKLFRFIAQNLTLKFGVAEIAKGRTYPSLLKKAISIKADLYIAHIQAALPAAVKAAQKNNSKCGFDAEDFHRQEVSDEPTSFEYRLSKYLEDKYLSQVNYFTTASPLISKEYDKLYPGIQTLTINNVFDSEYIPVIDVNKGSTVSLFWFSQTVGTMRGIEDVIQALNILKGYSFDLHLLGNASEYVKYLFTKYITNNNVNLYFHEPMPPDELVEFGSRFDIGIASEMTVPLNRDICLTNKIFTYLQAGLAIVASNTKAQKQFMNQYPAIGEVYATGDINNLSNILVDFHQNRDKLFEARKASLKLAREKLNWGNESQKFLALVKEIIGE